MASGASTRSSWIQILRSSAVGALCGLLVACGASYSGPEWSGRVVDMDTGAPIEGAIVVVRWQLERYSGNFAGWLFVTEAETDADGVFRLPAWGPVKAPSESGMQTRMSPNVPEVVIFKSGRLVVATDCCGDYGYLNGYRNYGSGPEIRESWANHRTFAVQEFHGTPEQYVEHIEHTIPTNGPDCVYLYTPRIFAAAVAEDIAMRATTKKGFIYQTLSRFEEEAKRNNCLPSVSQSIARFIK